MWHVVMRFAQLQGVSRTTMSMSIIPLRYLSLVVIVRLGRKSRFVDIFPPREFAVASLIRLVAATHC